MAELAQHELDAIRLDYSKWAAYRRQQGLSQDHGIWQFERDQTLERMQRDNAEARAKRLAAEEADRNSRRQADEMALNLELEPTKDRLRNAWLVDHPGRTSEDFEKVWPNLRANLLAERQQSAVQATMEAMRASGGMHTF